MRTEQGREGHCPEPRTPGPPGAGRGREDPPRGLGREHGPADRWTPELRAPQQAECRCGPQCGRLPWQPQVAGQAEAALTPRQPSHPERLLHALTTTGVAPTGPQQRSAGRTEGRTEGRRDDVGFDETRRQEFCLPQVPPQPPLRWDPCNPPLAHGPPALTQGSGAMCLLLLNIKVPGPAPEPLIGVWGSSKPSQLSGRETGAQI